MTITVKGPDGSTVHFPDGTSEGEMTAAMDAQFKPAAQPGAAAAPHSTPAEASPGAQPVAAPASDDPPASASGGRKVVAAEGAPRVDYSWEGVSPQQRETWQNFTKSGEFDRTASPGAQSHPFVLSSAPGHTNDPKELPVGSFYIDHDGGVKKAEGKVNNELGFYEGGIRSIDNAAIWSEDLLNAIPGGGKLGDKAYRLFNGRTAQEAAGDHQAMIAKYNQAGERGSVVSNIAGNLTASIPIMMATRNPLLAGGAMGALNTKDPHNAKGVALDTAGGAVMGKGADVGMRAVGAVIAPKVTGAVNRLLAKGVPLTPGQILGGTAQRVEEAVGSVPWLGDIVGSAQRRGIEAANKATINDALTPLGIKVPKNIAAGHDAVAFAQNSVDAAFDKVVPNLKATIDQPFAQDIKALRIMAHKGLPNDQAKVFEHLVQTEIAPIFNSGNGSVSGQRFKDAQSILKAAARKYSNSANPHDRDLADALMQANEHMMELLGRSNPAQRAALDTINKAYAKLVTVEKAAASAPTADRGIFTASGFDAAAKSGAGRRTAARGDAGHGQQQMAGDMGQVLSKKLPDSGTATRATVTAGLGAALFGKTLATVNPLAAGLVALGLTPYTRLGGKVTQALMTARPAGAAAVRAGVDKAAPTVGKAAAAAGTADRKKK
jgi:hypothetical protein